MFRRLLRWVLPAFAVAVAWMWWWLFPQPDVRVKIYGDECNSFEIMPGCRSVVIETGEGDSSTHLFDDETTRLELYELPGGERRAIWSGEKIHSFAYTPDGSRLAFRDGDGPWQLYELPSGQLIRSVLPTLNGDMSPWECRWTPDGRHFVIGSCSKSNRKSELSIYQVDSGELVATWPYEWLEVTIPLADGSGIAMLDRMTGELAVRYFDLARSPKITSLAGIKYAENLCVSNDGTRVCALIKNEKHDITHVCRWRLDTGLLSILPVPGPNGSIGSPIDPWFRPSDPYQSITKDGRFLITQHWVSSPIGSAISRIWDVSRDAIEEFRLPIDGQVSAIMVDPTGKTIIAVRHQLNEAIVFSADGKTELRRIKNCEWPKTWSSDGKWLASEIKDKIRWRWLQDILPGGMRNSIDQDITIASVGAGKITRTLHGRSRIEFDQDGKLWTATRKWKLPSLALDLTLERWSPDAPRPPWWLWLLTSAGVGFLAFGGRRTLLRSVANRAGAA